MAKMSTNLPQVTEITRWCIDGVDEWWEGRVWRLKGYELRGTITLS